MPFDDDEEETPNIEFNQPSGTIVTHGELGKITQNFGTQFQEVLPLMMSEHSKQISEERNRSMNLERSVYRLEPRIKEIVKRMNKAKIPLTNWLIRHGYTNPDAEWDFPPPDSEN